VHPPGAASLAITLAVVFSDDNFNAGTLKAPPDTSMKVLTPEVVLVSAHLQVEGQKLVGAGEIEVRDNHSGFCSVRPAGPGSSPPRCTTMPTGNRPMRGAPNAGAYVPQYTASRGCTCGSPNVLNDHSVPG